MGDKVDKKMPAWPERPFFADTSDFDWCSYYQRLATYWEARCRVAVECMTDVQRILVDRDIAHREAVGMYNTLVAIGPLPPDPTEGG